MDKTGAAGSIAGSDSDISLISDDEVEVAAPDASPSGARSSGTLAPKTWSEVDAAQLSHLALRIAQRTLPDADKGAEPLIIAASSPDHAQSLPHDPLGLGVGTSGRPLTTTTGSDVDDPSGWADPRLLPSSPSYDPEIHAVAAYKDIPWVDLIRGLDRLRSEVKEHTGQLKSLVKENFDRFLSSKDTVDDIALRLKAAEAEKGVGAHGATPAEVAMGMARSQNAAHGMFGQLLERHAKGESLRAMLGMLGEYDSLVGLPAQVRQCAEARDFAGVLTLYKKAVKVVEERSTREGKNSEGESHAVWDKLQAEVNRVRYRTS
jgi:Exocyst complex component Sec5